MQRTQNRRNPGGHVLGTVRAPIPADSIPKLSAQLPPVVYFIRIRGLIKIGHTVDLHNRKRAFGAAWTDVLAFTPGTRDDEAEMHRRFAQHLARGDEWFRPAPEIYDLIDEIRAGYGLSAVDRAA